MCVPPTHDPHNLDQTCCFQINVSEAKFGGTFRTRHPRKNPHQTFCFEMTLRKTQHTNTRFKLESETYKNTFSTPASKHSSARRRALPTHIFLDGGILLQLWREITPIQAGNYSSMFSKHIGIRGRHGYKQTIAIHATANYSNHF